MCRFVTCLAALLWVMRFCGQQGLAANLPPTFSPGPAVTVDEDAGPQTFPAWAMALSPGSAAEAEQRLTFLLSTDNPDLFAAAPTLVPDTRAWGVAGEVRLLAGSQTLTVDSYSVPHLVDWNGDGRPDLLVGEKTFSGQGKVRLYLNQGTRQAARFGTYTFLLEDSKTLSVPGSGCLGAFPRTVDWDGDGHQDLLLGLADGTVLVLVNRGMDTQPDLGPRSVVQVGPDDGKTPISVGARATPTVVDWNEDGLWDLLVGALDGQVRLFLNQGTANAPDFRATSFVLDGQADLRVADGRSSPAFADLTGDGLPDLLLGTTNGELWLYRNVGTRGAPAFNGSVRLASDAGLISTGTGSRSRPCLTDLNGDGILDILVGAVDGTVRWFAGHPPPTTASLSFTPAPNANGTATVTVQARDDGGTDDGGQDTSAPVTFMLTIRPGNDPPVNTQPPAVGGSPCPWQELSAVPGVWDDSLDRSPGHITFGYQWERAADSEGSDLAAIAGATAPTYLVAPADEGLWLRVRVTATDDGEGLPAQQTATAFSDWLRVDRPVFRLRVRAGDRPETELRFGLAAQASEAFDDGLDQEDAGPPGDGRPYAFFGASPVSGEPKARLVADFRPYRDVCRWRLCLGLPATRTDLDLAWDCAPLAADRLLVLQPLLDEQPVGAPIDMAQTASCRVTGPGVFEIAYGRPQSATLELAAGWNLVGVPTQGSCTAGSLLSAEAGRGRLAGPVWCWDGQSYAGLTATDVISAERGYWIFGFSPAALDLGAAIPADGFIDLREGWSLISPASAALVPELPGADAAFWGWDADFGQYVRLGVGNRLVPGLGYWVWVGPPGPWPLATGDGGSASPFP